MNEQDNAQILALEQLCKSTRQLIENMVQINAPTAEINAFTKDIEAITSKLAGYRNVRPIPHYNLAAACSNANQLLPYSPVSGPYNPIAPPLLMHYDAKLQQVIGKVNCGRAYEGPPAMLHGAVIAGIYDQLFALTSACMAKPGYTIYLNTTFKKPCPLYTELIFTSWVERMTDRKLIIKGQCTLNNAILSEAEGLFIQIDQST